MHKSSILMHATDTIFIHYVHIILTKLHEKLKHNPLKIFQAKMEKVQNTCNLCLIMLMNASLGVRGGG